MRGKERYWSPQEGGLMVTDGSDNDDDHDDERREDGNDTAN